MNQTLRLSLDESGHALPRYLTLGNDCIVSIDRFRSYRQSLIPFFKKEIAYGRCDILPLGLYQIIDVLNLNTLVWLMDSALETMAS